MNDHITKPLDVTKLFFTLAEWIKPKIKSIDTIDMPTEATVLNTDLYIPGIDIKSTLGQVAGNEQLLRKLLRRFVETQADTLSRVNSAINSNDIDSAMRLAHTIKSLAGSIGATKLYEQCIEIERTLKFGENGNIGKAIAIREMELESLVEHIKNAIGEPESMFATIKNDITVTIDEEILASDLKRLDLLLADLDFEASDAIESVANQLTILGQEEAVRKMQKLVGEFEYESAREVLVKIIDALDID